MCETNVKMTGIVEKSFKSWKENELDCGCEENDFTPLEWKLIWLCDDVFDLTTYDLALSMDYGKAILEVMTAIRDRKTFEYINANNEANYSKYIAVCNWFNLHNLIDWGTSIRGAWFEFNRYDKDFEFIHCHEVAKRINGEWVVQEECNVPWSEEAVNYLIDEFFREKEKEEPLT